MGVAHGIRVFTPMMLEAAAQDAAVRGPHRQHRVDGRPHQRAEHGRLQRQQARRRGDERDAVPGPAASSPSRSAPRCCARSSCRPASPRASATGPMRSPPTQPTRSQLIGKAMNDRAVGRGKVSAADVAGFVFDAIGAKRFYIYSHPKSLASVQTRLEDIVQAQQPDRPVRGAAGDRRRAARRVARSTEPARPGAASSRSSRPAPAARSRHRRRPG